jgi:hypothetical protein
MFLVHKIIPRPRHAARDPPAREALVHGHNAIGDIHPEQLMEERNGSLPVWTGQRNEKSR